MARLTPPKSPLVCDKNHSGCMWSLYSLFEFRQSNPSRKLLSDRKSLKREAVDDGNVKQQGLPTKFHERCHGNDDRHENLVGSDMPNEKKLKREEAFTEVGQLPKNHGKASKVSERLFHGRTDSMKQKQPPNPNSVAKSLDKLGSAALEETTRKKRHHKKRRGCGCKNVDFVNYDQLNQVNPQLLKVSDVAEAVVNQKFIEGKYLTREGVNQQSKQLLDALEILNSNKELFTKLLQDPNSLLVKHIQDLRDSQAQKQQTKSSSEAKKSECQTSNGRQHEEHASTQKLISSDKHQPEGRSEPQSSDTIVLLKPNPINMQNSTEKVHHCPSSQSFHGLGVNVQSVRLTYFSFGHIKRKFKHAIGVAGKEQELISIDGVKHRSPGKIQGREDGNKGKGMEIIGRNFQSIVHHKVENGEIEDSSFDIHRRDKIGKIKEFKARIGQQAASSSESGHKNLNLLSFSHPKRSESRIYEESRRYYYEIFKNKNEDNKLFQKQSPKALRRTVTSPEHDFLPLYSPSRDIKTGSVTAQMRFSPYSYGQVAYKNNWRLQREQKNSHSSSLKWNIETTIDSKQAKHSLQVVDTKPYTSDNLSAHAKVLEADSSIRGETKQMEVPSKLDGTEKNAAIETADIRQSEETIPSEIVSESDSSDTSSTSETSDTICQEETNFLDAPSESCNTDKTSTSQSTDTTNTNEENECFNCSRLDSPFEDQPSTCSTDVSPSTPSSIHRVEDSDGIIDRGDQSSPISVLEQFFTDAAASPLSTICQPAEEQNSAALVRPHLEPEINIISSLHVHGSISEYVKAVLQDSGLNWDELDSKCRASDSLLGSCLLDTSKLQSNQFCGDCKLLFDYISEVLLQVYDGHFSYSPWISFLKISLQSLPMEKFFIQEGIRSMHWHLQPQPSPKTLEQLIGKDLKRPGAWLNIRTDVEDVVGEMVGCALDELIMETIVELHI